MPNVLKILFQIFKNRKNNNMKKVLNIIFIISAISLLISAIVGASMGCPYALILLAPSTLFFAKPISLLIKKFKLNIK